MDSVQQGFLNVQIEKWSGEDQSNLGSSVSFVLDSLGQPTDEELRKIDRKASKGDHKTVAVSFHFVRMYKDAARFKMYRKTGRFPMVTKSTGQSSLMEVLQEDAKFPSSKKELIHHQGWKLIDLTEDKRVRASYMLEKLPEKTYNSINEVVQTLSLIKPR